MSVNWDIDSRTALSIMYMYIDSTYNLCKMVVYCVILFTVLKKSTPLGIDDGEAHSYLPHQHHKLYITLRNSSLWCS